MDRFSKNLIRPVFPHSLAVFRILFGIILLWEVIRYLRYGWIDRYWSDPVFNFTYGFFHWVHPLPQPGMDILFYLLGGFALFFTFGLFYRTSAVFIFLIFTYTFLLEQARYLNHFYLIALISFLMIFLPANSLYSLDSKYFANTKKEQIPYWTVLILQFQIGIVYFFGGVAKLNGDWLRGSPMDSWLAVRTDFPVLGEYISEPITVLFISYSGLFLDLLAFPLLMIRKTRPWVMLALVFFHLINDRLFSIGIFPWFMIGTMLIYLPTNWPRQLVHYLSSKTLNQLIFLLSVLLTGAFIATWFHEAFSPVPLGTGFLITLVLIWDFHKNPAERIHEDSTISRNTAGYQSKHPLRVAILLGVWCFVQMGLPLRHLAIQGNPSWTEEGHRFAWHMKLRSKSCDVTFYREDTDNPQTEKKKKITHEPWLQDWQRSKMESRPNLMIQYAKYLSDIHQGTPIYADVFCTLNGSEAHRLIDPNVDLSDVRFRDWKKNSWILRYPNL